MNEPVKSEPVKSETAMSDAQIIRTFLQLSTAGNTDSAYALVADDAEFWMSGRLVVSGALTAAKHRKASAGVTTAFPGGYKLHIGRVVEQSGVVALEAKGEGVMADGTVYAPSYAMFFEVREGLIRSVREYIDTEYVGATFRVPVRSN